MIGLGRLLDEHVRHIAANHFDNDPRPIACLASANRRLASMSDLTISMHSIVICNPKLWPLFSENAQHTRFRYRFRGLNVRLSEKTTPTTLSASGRVIRLDSLRTANLQTIDLSGVIELTSLAGMTGTRAKEINLKGCIGLPSLETLPPSCCESLRTLNIRGCTRVSDIGKLTTCHSLQMLNASFCSSLRDADPLQFVANLTSVRLLRDVAITELPTIGSGRLALLDCSFCSQLRNIYSLGGACFRQCVALSLRGCGQIEDIFPLANLTSLRALSLSMCRSVRDYESLASLDALETLDLSFSSSLDAAGLAHVANCRQLQSLSMLGCTNLEDVGALAGHPCLVSVNLSGCVRIRRITPLCGVPNLVRCGAGGIPALADATDQLTMMRCGVDVNLSADVLKGYISTLLLNEDETSVAWCGPDHSNNYRYSHV